MCFYFLHIAADDDPAPDSAACIGLISLDRALNLELALTADDPGRFLVVLVLGKPQIRVAPGDSPGTQRLIDRDAHSTYNTA
jgi:hypothetical protein